MEVSDSSDSSDDEDSGMEGIYNAIDEIISFLGEADEPLVVDTLGDAYTMTYGYATLVNAARLNDGIETELYDSGASRHMSPYRSRFENYKQIEGKSITAADKRLFKAIGVGNLRIQIPNGKNTTTILLKDVLHAPDLGLTLVLISCAAAAGYSLLFRGPFHRIFDPKHKLVGEIKARNGLYRVDHPSEPNAMVASTKEVVSVEELHRRMGHIAPEAARRLVVDGAVEGIEIDESNNLKSCDSCEYAKTSRKAIRKVREAPRAAKFGDEVHSDLWGPSPVQSPGGKEYYVSFTDDHTRYTRLSSSQES
jgi:hypothetical protein